VRRRLFWATSTSSISFSFSSTAYCNKIFSFLTYASRYHYNLLLIFVMFSFTHTFVLFIFSRRGVAITTCRADSRLQSRSPGREKSDDSHANSSREMVFTCEAGFVRTEHAVETCIQTLPHRVS